MRAAMILRSASGNSPGHEHPTKDSSPFGRTEKKFMSLSVAAGDSDDGGPSPGRPGSQPRKPLPSPTHTALEGDRHSPSSPHGEKKRSDSFKTSGLANIPNHDSPTDEPPQTPKRASRTVGKPSPVSRSDRSGSGFRRFRSLSPMSHGDPHPSPTPPPIPVAQSMPDRILTDAEAEHEEASAAAQAMKVGRRATMQMPHIPNTGAKDTLALHLMKRTGDRTSQSDLHTGVVPHGAVRATARKDEIARRPSLGSRPHTTTAASAPPEQPPPDAPYLYIPQSHLKFGKRVGVGGFAETFKGWWQGRVVAIKKLIQVADKPLTEEDLEDFRSELTLMAKLSHENIVQCYGGGDHLPDLFIVMEFCSRGSLASLLRKDKSVLLDFEAVRRIALGVARGVAYLHALDPPLIHRDLKCENVFLTEELMPKIGDFGVSVQTGASYMMSESGTYQYMAPELLRGERSNELVDVYSFAMLLYELVSRRVPYSDMGLASGVAGFRAAYSGLRPALDDCPWPELADLIADCWADAPSARPQMCQIVNRLTHMVGTVRPVPPKEPDAAPAPAPARRSLDGPRPSLGHHAPTRPNPPPAPGGRTRTQA